MAVTTQLHDVAEFEELLIEPPDPVRNGSARLFYKRGEGLKVQRFGMAPVSILLAEESDSADAVIQAEVVTVPAAGKIPRAGGAGLISPSWLGPDMDQPNRIMFVNGDGVPTTDAKLVWDSGDGILAVTDGFNGNTLSITATQVGGIGLLSSTGIVDIGDGGSNAGLRLLGAGAAIFVTLGVSGVGAGEIVITDYDLSGATLTIGHTANGALGIFSSNGIVSIGDGVSANGRLIVTDTGGGATLDADASTQIVKINNVLAFGDLGGDPGDSNQVAFDSNIVSIVTGKNFRAVGYIESAGSSFKSNGVQVVGGQGAAVADAAGGIVIDAEARTALNALLARLRAATGHGLIA